MSVRKSSQEAMRYMEERVSRQDHKGTVGNQTNLP